MYKLDSTHQEECMQLYTLEEVANILRVSIQTVRRMVNDGELPAVKIRGQWRVRKEDLETFIRNQS